MDLPVVVAQVNRGIKEFVPPVQAAMRHGVSIIGFWRDTKGDTTRGKGVMSWWSSFPSVIRTLQRDLDLRFSKFKPDKKAKVCISLPDAFSPEVNQNSQVKQRLAD